MSYESKCIKTLEILSCDSLISRLETGCFFVVTLEVTNIRDCITMTTSHYDTLVATRISESWVTLKGLGGLGRLGQAWAEKIPQYDNI